MVKRKISKIEATVIVTDMVQEVSDLAKRTGYLQSELKRYRYGSTNWEATADEMDEVGSKLVDARMNLKSFVNGYLK